MRAFLVLAALGSIMSLPWVNLFAYFLLIVIAIAALWLISVSIERRTISPRSKSRAIDHHYVAALESMVAEAETQVEALRAEVEQLRAAANRKSPDADASKAAALHGRVGLCEHAPEWLVAAARRAYRAKLHPDRHPPSVKADAERRFKTAESVFDAIAAQRASA
ncbi:hypothetical protein [Bosea beijingensis]|uniref:hypothetical protein n=1 Tax=Bosea beijingensis TaxID=3068632 RepID=UPI002741C611|nr:hypothetical protein [Bosea sp. REN20]